MAKSAEVVDIHKITGITYTRVQILATSKLNRCRMVVWDLHVKATFLGDYWPKTNIVGEDIQGISTQTRIFLTAFTDRNMQVRFTLNTFLKR